MLYVGGARGTIVPHCLSTTVGTVVSYGWLTILAPLVDFVEF
jgi:hypothetical protein